MTCSVEGCPSYSERCETLVDSHWLETGRPEGYFLCSRHWHRVPRYLKRRRTKLSREWSKRCPSGRYWDYPGGSPERIKVLQIERLIRATWSRCVAVASGLVCVGEGEGELDAGLAEELRRLALL